MIPIMLSIKPISIKIVLLNEKKVNQQRQFMRSLYGKTKRVGIVVHEKFSIKKDTHFKDPQTVLSL